MADETEKTPFESFQPFTPADPPEASKPRKKANGAGKKPRVAKVMGISLSSGRASIKTEELKKTRKSRQPRAVSLDVQTAVIALAGLKEADAHLLGQMVQALQKHPKTARGRIVAALGKVFA